MSSGNLGPFQLGKTTKQDVVGSWDGEPQYYSDRTVNYSGIQLNFKDDTEVLTRILFRAPMTGTSKDPSNFLDIEGATISPSLNDISSILNLAKIFNKLLNFKVYSRTDRSGTIFHSRFVYAVCSAYSKNRLRFLVIGLPKDIIEYTSTLSNVECIYDSTIENQSFKELLRTLSQLENLYFDF